MPRATPIEDVSSARILCMIRSLTTAAASPVATDALIRGVRRRLGYGRTGRHIRSVISDHLKVAQRRHLITRAGALISVDYTSINDYNLTELQACVMDVVTRTPMDRGEAIIRSARALGFRRTGGQIGERFKSAINGLIRRKLLRGDTAHIWRTARRRA